MKKEERSRLLKVGIFLASSIVVVLVIVFILGRTRSLFSDKIHIHTYFDNVNGLIVGAPVRLAGFEIGIVQTIRFATNLTPEEEGCATSDPMTQKSKSTESSAKKPKVYVELNIQKEYLPYIRKDSFAQLASKGLLGDTVIDIVIGDLQNEQVQNGACLKSEQTKTLAEVTDMVQKTIGSANTLLGNANALIGNANVVLTDTNQQLKRFLNEEVARDLHQSIHLFANMMEGIEKGHGLIHALVYDERLTKDVSGILAQGHQSMVSLRASVGRLNRILRQVQSGQGTLHSLFYEDQGTKVLGDLGHTIKEVDAILAQVRTGSGLVHSLIYEKDKENFLQSLNEVAATLNKLVKEVDEGKGTIGGLIKDPSVYKSVKRIIKNAQGTIEDSKVLTWILQYLNKDNRPIECRAD